jgi:hypothetical protein
MRLRTPLALAAASLLGAAVHARPLAAQSAPDVRRQAIAVNLLGIPFGWVTGEYERAVGAGATLGVGGSYIQPGDEDDNLSSIDAKLRYYPSERGLRGFSVGLTAGYVRIEEQGVTFAPGGAISSHSRVTDGPTIGVTADYNWLIGTRRRVLVGLGAGGKRIFAGKQNDDGFDFDLSDLRAYPTLRFVVGLAF